MIQDSLTHSDTISFAQAKHLLDTEPDCLLFDVREEEEFITGHPVEGWTTTMFVITVGFSGLFAVLTIVVKYLSLLVDLVFKQQKYLVESIEKLQK
mgnify:CR=1 FL=1